MSDLNLLIKNLSNKKINNVVKPLNLKHHIPKYKTVNTQTKNENPNKILYISNNLIKPNKNKLKHIPITSLYSYSLLKKVPYSQIKNTRNPIKLKKKIPDDILFKDFSDSELERKYITSVNSTRIINLNKTVKLGEKTNIIKLNKKYSASILNPENALKNKLYYDIENKVRDDFENKQILFEKNIKNKIIHLKQIVTFWNSFCDYINPILSIEKYKESNENIKNYKDERKTIKSCSPIKRPFPNLRSNFKIMEKRHTIKLKKQQNFYKELIKEQKDINSLLFDKNNFLNIPI